MAINQNGSGRGGAGSNGSDINDIVKLPVREQIGRYKYTKEDQLAAEYEKVTRQLVAETAELLGKEGL